ncbi:hypothetical protein ACLOJK_000609 [Asimina triloba]
MLIAAVILAKKYFNKTATEVPKFQQLSEVQAHGELDGDEDDALIADTIQNDRAHLFGSVYKGILRVQNSISNVVAVKVLDLKQSRAWSSFAAECEILGKIRNRNLVKIITSCSSMTPSGAEFKAVVMKFMSNGSLDRRLHHGEEPSMPATLGLLERLNISIDVAAAMDYLHQGRDPPVVHCDMKLSNVLLADEMTAHVVDFGLARILSQSSLPQSQSGITLGLKGSIVYIAPEYNYGSKVSTGGDVYSYGILLLEIFMGKKHTDEMLRMDLI